MVKLGENSEESTTLRWNSVVGCSGGADWRRAWRLGRRLGVLSFVVVAVGVVVVIGGVGRCVVDCVGRMTRNAACCRRSVVSDRCSYCSSRFGIVGVVDSAAQC